MVKDKEKIIQDLKLGEYKGIMDLYSTKYKTENIEKYFSTLEKMQVEDINLNFSSFSPDKKRDYFILAQSNPRILLALLTNPFIKNNEIKELISSPVLYKEIATVVAKREDYASDVADMLKYLIGERAIKEIYADKWFHSQRSGLEYPFSQTLNNSYLISYNECRDKDFFPLLFCDKDSEIENYCNMRNWNLTESETVMICNNMGLSHKLRDKVFDLGVDFDELYYTTPHMNKEMIESCCDAVFSLKPENAKEESAQTEADAQLLDYIKSGEVPEDMLLLIASKTIERLNFFEQEEDNERLRIIYLKTKSQDVLNTYDKLISPQLDIKEEYCRNPSANKVTIDVITDELCNLLKKKSWPTGKKIEHEIVGIITDNIYNSQLSQETYKKIIELGYLDNLKALSESKYVPDVILQNVIKDTDPCVGLYQAVAQLHLNLRRNDVDLDCAEAIAASVQNDVRFKSLYFSQKDFEAIKDALNTTVNETGMLKTESETIIRFLEENSQKLENISKSDLFYIELNEESAFKDMEITPKLGVIRSDATSIEELARRLNMLDNKMVDMITDDLIENLHRDIIATPKHSPYSHNSTLEMLNTYLHIDYYNEIYNKMAKATELNLEKSSQKEIDEKMEEMVGVDNER